MPCRHRHRRHNQPLVTAAASESPSENNDASNDRAVRRRIATKIHNNWALRGSSDMRQTFLCPRSSAKHCKRRHHRGHQRSRQLQGPQRFKDPSASRTPSLRRPASRTPALQRLPLPQFAQPPAPARLLRLRGIGGCGVLARRPGASSPLPTCSLRRQGESFGPLRCSCATTAARRHS